ncbi:unnamed protein product [Trichobilharzia regenti]|nr:unnamed protein product [Trichobilharzia regenti]
MADQNIQFIFENGKDNTLLFLVVMLTRRQGNSIQRGILRKKSWVGVNALLLNRLLLLHTNEILSDVINAMLSQNKRWLYEIPCEWNIQLSAFSLRERCPVVWKFTFSDQNQQEFNEVEKASLIKYPIAKLLHFNAHVKPEYFYPIPLRFPSAIGKWNEYYSSECLIHRSAFYSFSF